MNKSDFKVIYNMTKDYNKKEFEKEINNIKNNKSYKLTNVIRTNGKKDVIDIINKINHFKFGNNIYKKTKSPTHNLTFQNINDSANSLFSIGDILNTETSDTLNKYMVNDSATSLFSVGGGVVDSETSIDGVLNEVNDSATSLFSVGGGIIDSKTSIDSATSLFSVGGDIVDSKTSEFSSSNIKINNQQKFKNKYNISSIRNTDNSNIINGIFNEHNLNTETEVQEDFKINSKYTTDNDLEDILNMI